MNNYVGYKIKLNPTKEQINLFNQYFGLGRFVYNLSLDIQEKQRTTKEKYKFLTFEALNKKVTKMKKEELYSWLNNYDATTIKLVLKDSIKSYTNFFNNNTKHPRYKTRKNSKKQFPIRSERLTIADDHVVISTIGTVECKKHRRPEIIGSSNVTKKNITYIKYTNPRISYDGNNYFLSFSVPKDDNHNVNSYKRYGGNISYIERESSKSIGIDLGCKRNNWIVDSNGNKVELPDFSKENKKIKRLHKKLSRQLKVNKGREPRLFKDRKHPQGRTKNELKTIYQINKYYKKIHNKRTNKIYEYCNLLLESKPKSVVLEDIIVNDMLITDNSKECNKQKETFNRKILDSALYSVRYIITETLTSNHIPVIIAPKDYPSTKKCSVCGCINEVGKSRTYKCKKCGNIMDRDVNASMNLSMLGL